MSAAEKKFWEMPELVDRLHLDLDVRSTLCLAQVHDLTQKILQRSHTWNKLIRRSCLFNQSTTSKEKMDVVKDLAAILKLMKDSKANMVDLLDTIGKSSPPDVVSSQRHLGTVLIVGPTHPDHREVLLSDFLLLEEIEGAFGTTEQNVEAIFSGGTLEEPILSALSSRVSRQQKVLTSFDFSQVVLERKESAEAFKTLMQFSRTIKVSNGTINVPKPIGGEGWKMLAEGMKPDLFLSKVTVLKEDLDEASKEDMRMIWDALLLSGVVIVGTTLRRDKVKKTEGELGWTKLTEMKEMDKDEWAAQFLQLKVVARFETQDFREFTCVIKKTTKMKKLMNHFILEKFGVPVASLRFAFEGRRIHDDETPKDLEIEQDDVIDVFREQPLDWE